MTRILSLACLVGILGLASSITAQVKDKKVETTVKVILLIDAKTPGITDETKLKQIDFTKDKAGKAVIREARVKGKDQSRLNGTYLVKKGAIVIEGGKTLAKQDIFLAVEVGNQTLRNVVYVETFDAQSDLGLRTFHAYKAEANLPEKVPAP